jgi:hypothetical protein
MDRRIVWTETAWRDLDNDVGTLRYPSFFHLHFFLDRPANL